MRNYINTICEARNLDKDLVSKDELDLFCKNCMQIQVVKMNSFSNELNTPNWSKDVADEYMDPANSCSRFLIAMKAFESVWEEGNNQLGEVDGNLAADLQLLKPKAKAMTDAFGGAELEDKYLQEVLRFGRSKLHNVSAFLGGVVAQEACKLVMS